MAMFRTLNADEIECRVASVSEKGFSVLLYKTARTDMDLLDETVGPENWTKDYKEIKGNLFCRIGLYFDGRGWIYKEDCGIESREDGNGNEKKGEASDAMKRAGFNWGIGRELYTAPFVWVNFPAGADANAKKGMQYGLSVAEIGYDDNRRINRLVVVNRQGPVFTFGKQAAPKNDAATVGMLKGAIISLYGGDRKAIDAWLEKQGKALDTMSESELRDLKTRILAKRQAASNG